MDYAEMQFAATVRDVAKQLKQVASSEHFHDWAKYEQDDLKAKRAEWDLANPTLKFVPDAIRVLKEFAREVRLNNNPSLRD
jgi:hypothetical protein